MLHYYLRSSDNLFFKFDDIVSYDNILDDSKFVQDSETVRNSIFSSSGGSPAKSLKYDDSENLPSDFAVRVRQGKVDKAEVYQYQLKLQDEIKKGSKSASKSKEELSDSVATNVDKVTGDSSTAAVVTQS